LEHQVTSKKIWQRPKAWLFGFLTIFGLLVISVFILTRSFVLSPLIASVIGNRIHANVSIKDAHWSWSGVVVLDDLEIHVKGIEGEASRIALFDTTTLHVANWLPWQSFQIDKMSTERLTIRVAESEEVAGEFNFSSFMDRTFSSQGSSSSSDGSTKQKTQLFTQIDLKTLTLEIGTMGAKSWTLSDSVNFDVSLEPLNDHAYQLSLVNEDDSIHIKGICDFLTPEIALTVDPMQLDDSLFAVLPKTARLWCDAIALRGDVGELNVHWNISEGFNLSIDVENLAFQLPTAHSIQWVHYEDGVISKIHGEPSLRVDSGKILFDGNSASLEQLEGVLLPPKSSRGSSEIPFQISLKISELPALRNLGGDDWFEEMKESSPFIATFKIDQFKSKVDGGGQADLPVAIARILQLFHLKDWNANGQLIVERSAKNSEVEYKGNIAVNGGTGWYSGFVYPLHDVKALIDIHNDTLVIQSFDAIGSEGADVAVLGDVKIAENTEVNLSLLVTNAPLDKAMHDAVPKPVATVMDRLLDQDALDRLIVKGVIAEDECTLGGTVDMALSIHHSGKEDDSVEISGDLVFQDTTIIHNGFPFPITIGDGKIRLEPNQLMIPVKDRIAFSESGGGRGVIAGFIGFDTFGNTEPNLVFKLTEVPISNLMVEAVSISSGNSYDTVKGVLGGLALAGQLDATGVVSTSEDGKIKKEIIVTIEGSTATPSPTFSKAIHATNAFWPDDFKLTDVNAKVTVNNDGVHVEKVNAQFDGGDLSASMNIHGGDSELEVRAANWPISEQLVFLLPPSTSSQLSPAWHFLEPTGRLDANIRMNHAAGESSLHVNAVATVLGISGNGDTVLMHCDRGEIIVDDVSVFLNDLHFSLDQEGTSQGSVTFDGNIQVVDEKTTHDIQAKWDHAVANSPLSRAITGIIGGQDAVKHFDIVSPKGIGAVTLETVKNTNTDHYKIVIVPETLSATLNNREAHTQFTQPSNENQNQIVFDNSGVHFDHLFGKLGQGKFSIDGKIHTNDQVKGAFLLDWDGPADDQSLFAVLPSVVGDTLEAIEIGNGTSKVVQGEVSLFGSSWTELGIDFHGDIDLSGVSMNAGLPLTEIDGTTEVKGLYDEEKLTSLQLHLQLDKMTAVGREITDISGGLVLDSSTQKMIFENVRGTSSSGVVTLAGWIDVDASKEFQITILLAGVKLEDEDKEDGSTFSGELTGWLAIGGVRGNSDTRIGVGEMKVTNGMFAKIPTIMRALQVLHFTLPTSNAITTALVNLYIEGEEVHLQEIKLTGDDTSIQGLVIRGSGTIKIPSFELDVDLHPRVGWPIIRQIMGALSDQLYAVKVRGQLLDPAITFEPLPIFAK